MYVVIMIALGFIGMEIMGWVIHKFIMHGPLWNIHKTHHQSSKSFFESNDIFSLFFGSIAICLIFLGLGELDYRLWLGIGISLYGLCYFILHDILIHRRLNLLKKPTNRFLSAIFKAHQAHHMSNKKDKSVSFGLFIVDRKYFKKQS